MLAKINRVTHELDLVALSYKIFYRVSLLLSFVENIFASGEAKRVRENENLRVVCE